MESTTPHGRLKRILIIDRELRCPEAGLTANRLARRLGVSRRTIYRDIFWLRDELGAPVVVDQQRGGYRYADPDYRWDGHLASARNSAVSG